MVTNTKSKEVEIMNGSNTEIEENKPKNIHWKEASDYGCIIHQTLPQTEMLRKEGYIREYHNQRKNEYYLITFDREYVLSKLSGIFKTLALTKTELKKLFTEIEKYIETEREEEKQKQLNRVQELIKMYDIDVSELDV